MVTGNNHTPTVMAVAVMARVVFLTHRLNKKIKSKHQISHAKDFVYYNIQNTIIKYD